MPRNLFRVWSGWGSPIVKALKRILKKPQKRAKISQKYITKRVLRGVNQNPPKKLQHEIMFYDVEIVAQEQAEREVILEMKKEKIKV